MPGVDLIAAKQPPPSGATPPIPPQKPETSLEGDRRVWSWGFHAFWLKTRLRPFCGVWRGVSGWRVNGAKRPRLAGAARSEARTRARRGEPLTRQERPEPDEWGQDKGEARQDCPPSLTAASAGRGAAPHIRRLESTTRRRYVTKIACISYLYRVSYLY